MPLIIFTALWAVVATVAVNDSNKSTKDRQPTTNDKCYYRTYTGGKSEVYCPNGVK